MRRRADAQRCGFKAKTQHTGELGQKTNMDNIEGEPRQARAGARRGHTRHTSGTPEAHQAHEAPEAPWAHWAHHTYKAPNTKYYVRQARSGDTWKRTRAMLAPPCVEETSEPRRATATERPPKATRTRCFWRICLFGTRMDSGGRERTCK